jgi:hypothetical protein
MTFRRTLGVTVLAAGLLLSACGGGGKDASTASTSSTSSVKFPSSVSSVEPGVATWTVLLAAAPDPKAPELAAAVSAARAAGYKASVRTCDIVASMIGIPIKATSPSVSVFFRSQADASAALEAFHATGFAGGSLGQMAPGCKL